MNSEKTSIQQNLSLRPAIGGDAADEAFLERLYADTRRDELAFLNWSREQEDAFFKMQFQMQTAAYRIQHPDADYSVIEFDRSPAGRLIVERGEREIKLIDISLLAKFRNRGIGEFFIEKLKDEAAASGKTLSLSVLKTNFAAQRLYERLGFAVVADTDLYFAMRWQKP